MAYTTINKSADHFNTVLYTGNGSTQSITGVGFQPDFTWIKNRGSTDWNWLQDAVRGATKVIFSNTSNDQDTINMWNLVTNPQVSGVKTCWASMGGDRYEGAANAHPQYGYTWINSGSVFDGFSYKSSSGHNFRNTGKIMVFGLSDS